MRRVIGFPVAAWIVAFVLTLSAICAALAVSLCGIIAPANACETTSIAPRISPDGRYTAIVDANACENGYAFLSYSNYVVRVVAMNTSKSDIVFSCDDTGRQDERPVMKWIGANKLQITALAIVGVGVHKATSGAVTIAYRYGRR